MAPNKGRDAVGHMVKEGIGKGSKDCRDGELSMYIVWRRSSVEEEYNHMLVCA